jgi:hypothetical protein
LLRRGINRIRLRNEQAEPGSGETTGGVTRPKGDQPRHHIGHLGIGGNRGHLALPQVQVPPCQRIHVRWISHRRSIEDRQERESEAAHGHDVGATGVRGATFFVHMRTR